MTLPEHFRATRQSLVPKVIEYRTTDPRIVDAVRMLDVAADQIEYLTKVVACLRKRGDEMAKILNADAKRRSGVDNAVDGAAQWYGIDCLYIDRGELPPQ